MNNHRRALPGPEKLLVNQMKYHAVNHNVDVTSSDAWQIYILRKPCRRGISHCFHQTHAQSRKKPIYGNICNVKARPTI